MFKLRDVHYSVRGKRILELDALEIESEKLTLVLGPNGAGKSTLLRILAGLLEPTQGAVDFKGLPLASYDRRQKARELAWVPTQLSFGFDMTVFDLALLGRYPWHLGYPKLRDKDLVRASLRQLEIADLSERLLSTLSSGELQKAQIARALAGDASCLILDEPCAHLDVGARFEMMSRLRLLVQAGKTVIVSSHDLYLAPRFASAFLLLREGQKQRMSAAPPTSAEIETLYGLRENL